MARRYLVDPLPAPGDATLPEDVAHHLAKVLRARAGDAVVLFDGHGQECPARVISLAGGEVRVLAAAPRAAGHEPHCALEVAFALPKGPRADEVFEHGTEVGIRVFRPLITERSREGGARVERWRRIVRAAAGQCDRAFVPEIAEPESLEALLARVDLPVERSFCDPGGEPLRATRAARALLVIGPEGGFSDAERAAMRALGLRAAGLSPLTLRVETAVLVGAALALAAREA